jgi:hypothetical protein
LCFLDHQQEAGRVYVYNRNEWIPISESRCNVVFDVQISKFPKGGQWELFPTSEDPRNLIKVTFEDAKKVVKEKFGEAFSVKSIVMEFDTSHAFLIDFHGDLENEIDAGQVTIDLTTGRVDAFRVIRGIPAGDSCVMEPIHLVPIFRSPFPWQPDMASLRQL